MGVWQAPKTPSKVAARKTSVKETAKIEDAAEDNASTVKRAKNAFMYFSAGMRASVKGRDLRVRGNCFSVKCTTS